MTKTNPADGRSRVKAGFRDSGQFMKEYLDPNLAPPNNSKEYELGEDELEEWLEDTGLGSEEAQEWARAEFGIDDAAYLSAHFHVEEAIGWRDEGFSASDAVCWSRAHFSTNEAKEWREAGFEPELAMEWQRMRRNKATTYPGSIEHMKEWRKFTIDPIEVKKWTNLFGTSDPKASQQWRDYGFTADEYELWQEFDPKTARAKRDAGVDVQTALAEPHERQNKWISSQ
jgi:hypothetical protein